MPRAWAFQYCTRAWSRVRSHLSFSRCSRIFKSQRMPIKYAWVSWKRRAQSFTRAGSTRTWSARMFKPLSARDGLPCASLTPIDARVRQQRLLYPRLHSTAVDWDSVLGASKSSYPNPFPGKALKDCLEDLLSTCFSQNWRCHWEKIQFPCSCINSGKSIAYLGLYIKKHFLK